jgi:hypothetical protein
LVWLFAARHLGLKVERKHSPVFILNVESALKAVILNY